MYKISIRIYKPRPGEVFRSKSPSSTSPISPSNDALDNLPIALQGTSCNLQEGLYKTLFSNGYKVPGTQLVSLPDLFQQLVIYCVYYISNIGITS